MPFYKLLRKDSQIEPDDMHYKNWEILKNDLLDATKIILRLPTPGVQYVVLCVAIYYSAGFVLMIEDYIIDQNNKKKKVYAPVSFGSQLFTTAQLKFSINYKKFLALYYALDQFAHYLWEATKPNLILTDNRSLTQFFISKVIPPSLWNFWDCVLSFNVIIAHIPGKANYAADFLSRVQTDKTAGFYLKITENIPRKY